MKHLVKKKRISSFQGRVLIVLLAGLLIGTLSVLKENAFIKNGNGSLENGDYEKAVTLFSRYLASAQATDKGKLKCRISLGLCYWNLNNLERAYDQFSLAEAVAQSLGAIQEQDFCREALTVHDLYLQGREFVSKRDFRKAIDSYKSAAVVAGRIHSPALELKVDMAWSLILLSEGNFEEFKQLSQKALDISRQINHRFATMVVLSQIGSRLLIENRISDALSSFLPGIQAAKSIRHTDGTIQALSNASEAYVLLGDYNRAFELTSEAMKYVESSKTGKLNPDLLLTLGRAIALRAANSGDPDEFARALLCFNESLSQYQKNENRISAVWAMIEIGETLLNTGEFGQARPYIEKCLALTEPVMDESFRPQLMNDLGLIDLSAGEHQKAIRSFSQALELGQSLKKLNSRISSYVGLARCYQAEGINARALDYYSEAIKIIEQIGAMQNSDIDQALFMRNRMAAFQGYIDLSFRLLADSHDDRYASLIYSAAESAKARSFVKFMQRRKSLSPTVAESLENLQKSILDSHSALLEYFLGSSASYLISVTGTTVRIYQLPAQRDLADALMGFLNYCESPRMDRIFGDRAASRLYSKLLAPAIAELPELVDRLVIIPDGILYKLPFEALRADNSDSNNSEYLVEKYAISYAPSAGALKILLDQKRPASYRRELLAFGEPNLPKILSSKSGAATPADIFRMSLSSDGYRIPAIPYSRREVKDIGKLFVSGRADLFLGNSARKTLLKNVKPGDYRIVHIACHAVSDDIDPYRSAVFFSSSDSGSDDGLLRLEEMYDLRLGCDLVVLSACQTGTGPIITNEGALGLPRVFFYSGARSVVSSIWNIEDKSASKFMLGFYKRLLDGQTSAQALRSTKMEFIRSGYSHPFYWSPFILTGDPSTAIH